MVNGCSLICQTCRAVSRGVCQGQNSGLSVWLPFPHKGLAKHQLGKVDSFGGRDNRNERVQQYNIQKHY